MAANKAQLATEIGTCKRCGNDIVPGLHFIYKYNLPRPEGSQYHVDCNLPTTSIEPDYGSVERTARDYSVPTVDVPTNGNGHGKSAVEQAIEDLIKATQPKKQELDINAVQSIVRNEIQKAILPTVVEIRQEGKEPKTIKGTHKQFAELLSLVHEEKNTYLYGAAGGGKDTVAKQVAEALDLPFYHISLNLQSTPTLITGYMDAHGKYVETSFYRWYTGGGVFHLAEYDNTGGNFQNVLNTGLENGSFAFPCGERERHPNAIAIASGNTALLGASRMYSGRQAADGANRERFIFLKWEYDTNLETAIAKSKNPEHGEVWCTWIQMVRKYVEVNKTELLVTPRASIKGAGLLKAFPVDKVADMVLFKGCAEDTKTKILSANPLPKVGA